MGTFHICLLLPMFLLAACMSDKESASECPDLSGRSCEEVGRLICDECGNVFNCFDTSTEVAPTWGHTDIPCECIDDSGHRIYWDSANPYEHGECADHD